MITGNEFLDLFLAGFIGALPATVLAIWSWVKAKAAETEAKWDDEAVAFVEKIAQGIVDKQEP